MRKLSSTIKEQEKLAGGTGGNCVGGQLPDTWMFRAWPSVAGPWGIGCWDRR